MIDTIAYIAPAVLITLMVAMVIIKFIAAGKEDKREHERLSKFKDISPIKRSSEIKSGLVILFTLIAVFWFIFADPFAHVTMPINFSFSFILAGIVALVGYILYWIIAILLYPVKTIRAKVAAKLYVKNDGSTLSFLIATSELLNFINVKSNLFNSVKIGDIVDIEYKGNHLRKISKVKKKS